LKEKNPKKLDLKNEIEKKNVCHTYWAWVAHQAWAIKKKSTDV